jgi:predicted metal-dependent hydrolase
MSDEWKHQVRIYLEAADAEIARRDPEDRRLQSIAHVLERHDAALRNQLQAFEDYVSEAEKSGVDAFPLYKWTKLTIDDPEKRAKHLKAFALVVSGEEVYPKSVADALAADLEPLVGQGLILRLSRHDTNPENNIRPPANLS